jgi:hypothetical protein
VVISNPLEPRERFVSAMRSLLHIRKCLFDEGWLVLS